MNALPKLALDGEAVSPDQTAGLVVPFHRTETSQRAELPQPNASRRTRRGTAYNSDVPTASIVSSPQPEGLRHAQTRQRCW